MLKRLVEARPRLRLRPSALGQPEFTVGWETLELCAREAMPLLAREHAETERDERLPYDPDWDRLLSWSASGALDVWTLRADGELIGYASVLFMPHLYSRQVQMANVHAPYVMPEWRLGRLGLDMLKVLFSALKDRGVDVVDVDIDVDARLHNGLDRMGFVRTEIRQRKWLNV